MRFIYTFSLVCLIFLFYPSCLPNTIKNGKGSRDHPQPGRVYPAIPCSADTTITYALFIPKTRPPEKGFPLILAFDPHASGLLPLDKYKDLASQSGFILAASNNSKNGLSTEATQKIYRTLMTDLGESLAVDKSRVYLMGFSGGARVSIMLALIQPGIRGVIACGAGLPGMNSIPSLTFELFGITGLGDFNLHEMLQLEQMLDQTAVRHFFTTFEGTHEWPPEEVIQEAIQWLNLEGKPGINPVEKHALSLKQNPAYLKHQQYREKILQKEDEERQLLMDALVSKDHSWWAEKISILQTGSRNGKDQEMVWMNKRLLSFLSILCYSQINTALNQDARDMVAKWIRIYAMADPENPEPMHLQSVLDLRNHDTIAYMQHNRQAIDKGYKEKE